MNIIFATCLEQPDYWHDDVLLADALREHGHQVMPAPWNGDFGLFRAADLIVVRSTWDYTEHYAAFLSWFDALDESKVPVVNSTALMRWNVDKHYLTDLAARGAPLPRSEWVEARPGAIQKVCEQHNWRRAIVKPHIGAGGRGVTLIDISDPQTIDAAVAGARADLLLQEFVPEIQTHGETSLIYIERAFSHAVVKRPAPNKILSQPEHGGIVEAVTPPTWALESGAKILELLPSPPLITRLDAVILDNTLKLMEVEVTEPELFMAYAPGSAQKLASTLLKYNL